MHPRKQSVTEMAWATFSEHKTWRSKREKTKLESCAEILILVHLCQQSRQLTKPFSFCLQQLCPRESAHFKRSVRQILIFPNDTSMKAVPDDCSSCSSLTYSFNLGSSHFLHSKENGCTLWESGFLGDCKWLEHQQWATEVEGNQCA